MRGNVKVYQKKIVDKRRKKLFFSSLFGFFVAGLLVCGLSLLSQLDSLAIKEIKVEGTSRLKPSTIIAAAASRLEGNYAWLFSKSNVFLYPRAAIQADIAALPAVKSAEVSSAGHEAILVSIAERSEAAGWCQGTEAGAGDCYSVDEDGFIFAPTADPHDVLYRDSEHPDKGVGGRVMPPDDFKNMQFFLRELTVLGVEPAEALLEKAGYREIRLKKGGSLVIDSTDDLSAVLSNLSSVLSDKSIVPDLGAFLSKLEYIRLDAGNKVFYKLKK